MPYPWVVKSTVIGFLIVEGLVMLAVVYYLVLPLNEKRFVIITRTCFQSSEYPIPSVVISHTSKDIRG